MKGHKGIWKKMTDRDVIYIDCGGDGYKSIYICQNSLNFTFQEDIFICMKLQLNKMFLIQYTYLRNNA